MNENTVSVVIEDGKRLRREAERREGAVQKDRAVPITATARVGVEGFPGDVATRDNEVRFAAHLGECDTRKVQRGSERSHVHDWICNRRTEHDCVGERRIEGTSYLDLITHSAQG